MNGNKTYLTCAVAILYIIGGKLGFWTVDKDVLAAIGMGALAFLRHGVSKGPDPDNATAQPQTAAQASKPPGTFLFLLLSAFSFLLLMSGCAYHCAKIYDSATGKVAAKERAFTFWDSQNSLTKLRLSTVAVTNKDGTWSPGINIGSIGQESSSTNISADMGNLIGTAFRAYTGKP